jgi:DNA repair exonuclease SbcCD ATPase subunit
MSDTPRTQAAWETWIANGCAQRLKQESEKLERELAAVTKERDEAVLVSTNTMTELSEVNGDRCRLIDRIKRLEEALAVVVPKCDWLHHEKKHQHCASEPCPVVEMILKAKEAR